MDPSSLSQAPAAVRPLSCQAAPPTYRLPLTVDIYTEQGTPLTLQLTARDRIKGGHPQPIVEFRYSGGVLCSSYYLSDFMAVSTGLCVDGGGARYRQDLSAETVALCQAYCLTCQAP